MGVNGNLFVRCGHFLTRRKIFISNGLFLVMPFYEINFEQHVPSEKVILLLGSS